MNRMLRRIFRPKREEVVGGWTKLQMRSFTTCKHDKVMVRAYRMHGSSEECIHNFDQTGMGG
jgi:hypothetical protein